MTSSCRLSALLCLLALANGCQNAGDDYRVISSEETQPETVAPPVSPEATSAPPAAAAHPKVTSESEPAVPALADSTLPATTPPAAEGPAPAAPSEPFAGAATTAASSTMKADTAATPAGSPDGKPREIKILVPHKEFTTEGKDKALRVTFDDLDLLKVCNMEPVPPDVMDHLPDWLKNLDGKKIILRGWMFPAGRQEGISSFLFVRDNGICCFGRDPKVYDKLGVTMQPGLKTSYIAGRPFDVEATFRIEPDIEGPEEGLWWLYRLEEARVIDQQ